MQLVTMILSWFFLHFCHNKFGAAVIAKVLDKKIISSWPGDPGMPMVSDIGYCPMVDGSSTDSASTELCY